MTIALVPVLLGFNCGLMALVALYLFGVVVIVAIVVLTVLVEELFWCKFNTSGVVLLQNSRLESDCSALVEFL